MMTTEYVYKDSAGVVLGTITRMDNGTAKTFRASKGFPNPRPLYGLRPACRSASRRRCWWWRARRRRTPRPSCCRTLWW